MFTGTHERAIDDKGRVVVPAEYRTLLAGGAYVGKLERQLGLWLPDQFGEWVDGLKEKARAGELSRDHVRIWLSQAPEVRLDGQGRIFLPPTLRLAAGLDDQLVFIGNWSVLEIWQEARWRQVEMGGDAEVVDALEQGFV